MLRKPLCKLSRIGFYEKRSWGKKKLMKRGWRTSLKEKAKRG